MKEASGPRRHLANRSAVFRVAGGCARLRFFPSAIQFHRRLEWLAGTSTSTSQEGLGHPLLYNNNVHCRKEWRPYVLVMPCIDAVVRTLDTSVFLSSWYRGNHLYWLRAAMAGSHTWKEDKVADITPVQSYYVRMYVELEREITLLVNFLRLTHAWPGDHRT